MNIQNVGCNESMICISDKKFKENVSLSDRTLNILIRQREH